jgi:hypothetical protein
VADLNVRRWTGWFGLAGFVLFVSQVPLYLVGSPVPPLSDAVAHAQHLAHIRIFVLTRVLLDLGLYVCLMVFFAGFRQLVLQARPAYEWVATLTFGAGLVWAAVTLVANSLEGGAALDTLGGKADPTAVRAMLEGALLIYNGAIAFAVTGLFMAAAGVATLATQALPKWTGWVACTSAVLCVLAIPSMFAEALTPTGFYNPLGWAPVLVANVPPLVWFLGTSLAMLRSHQDGAPQPEGGAPSRRHPP